MSKDFLDYEAMVQDALRGVLKKTLIHTATEGLSGNHHFYITFNTTHPNVVIPEYLKDQYGDELTIVLQYEFWDLHVDENHFSVTLCFEDAHENIVIPYNSLISFVDPSVKFGLQFTPVLEEAAEEKISKANSPKAAKKKTAKKDDSETAEEQTSNIITLDAFRKK